MALRKPLDKRRSRKLHREVRRTPKRFMLGAMSPLSLKAIEDGLESGRFSKEDVRSSYGVNLDDPYAIEIVPSGADSQRRIFGLEAGAIDPRFQVDPIAFFVNREFNERG
jgi:hypothetical protein